jgi:hypothetical protein
MRYVDGAVVLLLLAVILIMLSLMREVALLQERITIYRQLLLRPAKPSYIGGPAPAELLGLLNAVSTTGESRAVIIFLRPDCAACQEMAHELEGANRWPAGLLVLAVVGRGPQARKMIQRLSAAGLTTHADPDETIFDIGEIRSTPNMLLINRVTGEAEHFSEGSDYQWLDSVGNEGTVGSLLK